MRDSVHAILRSRSVVAMTQGAFWLLSGVWPIVHMPSFLAVSGPKHDLWLVRTVGALIAVVGFTLMMAGWRRRVSAEVVVLGIGGAAALATIDLVYALSGVIWKIYLLDAAIELAIIAAWLWTISRSLGRTDAAHS